MADVSWACCIATTLFAILVPFVVAVAASACLCSLVVVPTIFLVKKTE